MKRFKILFALAFAAFAVTLMTAVLSGCTTDTHGPSVYDPQINAGVQGASADALAANMSNQSAAQHVAAAQSGTTGARADLKTADGQLGTAPQNPPIPQARTTIGSADQKLAGALTQLGNAQADLTSQRQSLADAEAKLASTQATLKQQQDSTAALESQVKSLQAFKAEWQNAWFGPRLHHWFTGIIVFCIGLGVLWAAMSFFPAMQPILAVAAGAIGAAATHIVTAGIPLITDGISYVITRGKTLVKSAFAWIESKHATATAQQPAAK